jgi:hypothetical protein
MKTCSTCKEPKEEKFFSKKTSAKDGLNSRCKDCDKKAVAEWRKDNPDKAKESTDRWNSENREHVLSRQRKHYQKNSVQIMDQMKKFLKDNPEHGLLKLAKQRCKKSGVPCTITIDDIFIPEFCPILGVRLEFGDMATRDNSPSLDRVVPEFGYVPGNVAVISYRANRIKNEGLADEHRRIADWMDAQKINWGEPGDQTEVEGVFWTNAGFYNPVSLAIRNIDAFNQGKISAEELCNPQLVAA